MSSDRIRPRARVTSNVMVGGCVTVVAILLGLNLVVLKVALRYAGPLTVQALSVTVAGSFLFALAHGRGISIVPRRGEHVSVAAVSLSLTIMGSLGVVLGVQYIGAGLAALLLSTTPIITMVLAWLFLKNPPRPLALLGVVVGVLGVSIVIQGLDPEDGVLLGVAWVLAGGFGWATGLTLMKTLLPGVNPLKLVTMHTAAAIPLLLVLAFGIEGYEVEWSLPFVGAILYAGVASKAISFLVQLYAVRIGSPEAVSATAMLVPVTGMLAGMLFLAERVTLSQLLGTVVVIGAVATVLRAQRVSSPMISP